MVPNGTTPGLGNTKSSVSELREQSIETAESRPWSAARCEHRSGVSIGQVCLVLGELRVPPPPPPHYTALSGPASLGATRVLGQVTQASLEVGVGAIPWGRCGLWHCWPLLDRCIFPPCRCWNLKHVQMLLTAPWGADSPSPPNSCHKLMPLCLGLQVGAKGSKCSLQLGIILLCECVWVRVCTCVHTLSHGDGPCFSSCF